MANALFPQISGKRNPDGRYFNDAFVAELSPDGTALEFSTYLGGSATDSADALAVDGAGYVYVTGYTYSTNFPVANPLPITLGGTTNTALDRLTGKYSAFVTKFAPGGSGLAYSTYLGGKSVDEGQGIAADSAGYAYVTGYTASTNFPTSTNAFQSLLNGDAKPPFLYDAFVARLTPLGDALAYSTLLGGGNNDAGFRIAVDGAGNAFITGSSLSLDFPNTATNIIASGFTNSARINTDAFLTRLDPSGALVYSARFGGSRDDVGWDLALDAGGDAFVVGTTASPNFPTFNTNGFPIPSRGAKATNDVFVTAFNADGSALLYSIYLGGSRNDYGYGIAVDPAGNAYVAGRTLSTNFPVVAPLSPSRTGANDAFLAKISLGSPALKAGVTDAESLSLRWRAFSPEYDLEVNQGWNGSNAWAVAPQDPVLTNGWHTITVPTTNPASFYRLERR